MPLMTTKPMFDLAYDGGFAVGAFNVNNMELAQAIIDASAREKSPLILQISKGARKYANIRYLKHIIDAAVEEHPELPIAVHCDHGDTLINQIAMAVQKYGVCKVNIDTDLRLAMTAKIREVFATKPAEFDPRNYLGPAREAITKMVQRKLHMLNSAGKAETITKHWEKIGKPMPAFYKKTKAA